MMTYEKILSIEDCSFTLETEEGGSSFDGYKITTDNRTVYAGISNKSTCCEDWGYITSHDNPLEFIGSRLLDIRITDKNLKSISLPEGIYEDSAIFITFITSYGDFQLAVYNEHEGYYSHQVIVRSNQLNYDGEL